MLSNLPQQLQRTPSIVDFAYFFSFTPFFSPFPLSTDLQPFSFLLMLTILLINISRIKFNILHILLALLLVFSLIPINGLYLKGSATICFALIASVFYANYRPANIGTLAKYLIVTNFFVLTLHFFFPSIITPVLEQFVRTIKVVDLSGPRGVSGLAAEPSFSAVLFVFYFLLLYSSFRQFLLTKYEFVVYSCACIIAIMLTKSGSGALFLVIALSAILLQSFSIKRGVYILVLLFFTPMVSVYLAESLGLGGRFLVILELIFSSPTSIIFLDSSVGMRVVNILVGWFTLFESPFGHGLGSFDAVASSLVAKYAAFDYIDGVASKISAFAEYSVAFGVFYVLFIGACFLRIFWRYGSSRMPYAGISLLMVAASFSFAFPLVWFCLFYRGRL